MFEFEPGLMIWTTISFGMFVYLMYRFALPPLLQVLKEREKVIADSLSAAEESQRKAEEIMSSSAKKIAEAGEVARKIIDGAKSESEKLKQDVLDSAKKQADLFLARAKEDLRRERDSMVSEILSETADLVVEASSKVIGQRIDKQQNLKLIEESLPKWKK